MCKEAPDREKKTGQNVGFVGLPETGKLRQGVGKLHKIGVSSAFSPCLQILFYSVEKAEPAV